ncbi:MAG: SMP-30/gluconolactonase/LRE family protein, partial [Duganella sp.]
AMLDALEQSATGRVVEYDPAGGAVRVVATGLSFANGIVLSEDERAVLVSESARYRVWKIDVAANALDLARPTAQASIVLDHLPGYPDNLTRGANGRIWLGLAGPRNELDAMAEHPFLRSMVLRVPRVLWKAPPSRGHVLAFTESGAVVTDLQDASGKSAAMAPLTTGATEMGERLYIHSIGSGQLGWLTMPQK